MCIRLKSINDAYNEIRTDYFGGDKLAEHVRRTKWGFPTPAAIRLIKCTREIPELCMTGLSCHIGRVAQGLAFLQHYGRDVGRMVVDIHKATGFVTELLDIGGGWARERDPESRSMALHHARVESCAKTACDEILAKLDSARIPVPVLRVEPGRYIVGNAFVLLAKVATIKHDLGMTWINIDAGTNELPRIDTNASASAYHVLAANKMHLPADWVADVVAPICSDSLMGRDLNLPELQAGNCVAILKAGMYSESASTQFNSSPRPATTLVNGKDAEVIKQRESIEDIFRLQRVPERLRYAEH